jgi:D-arabinose 1-dehydrogenase-like Zn-dependent alcohol dehydrogenase
MQGERVAYTPSWIGWKLKMSGVDPLHGTRLTRRYCPDTAMIGLIAVDGAFANYCIVGARSAAIIPDGMSFAQAATFSCAGVTAYGCIKKTKLKAGEVIGFSGLGAIGMLCMEMAKCMVG